MKVKQCLMVAVSLLWFSASAAFGTNCAGGTSKANPAAEMRADRERECERVNSECALSCGTPEVLERRIPSRQTPAYISTYVRCTSACGKQYELCLKRIADPE